MMMTIAEFLIIKAVGHRLTDEPNRLFALGLTLGFDDVVGVVKQDAVAALAGRDAGDRGRQLEAGHVVFEAALAGLDHGEALAPELAIARAGSSSAPPPAVLASGWQIRSRAPPDQ
jgi:hypothetical protein